MSRTAGTTGDQLTNALHALGIRFIMGGDHGDESLHKQPARLIAALAKSKEARLRLSLIPLFLEHPEFSVHVRVIAKNLRGLAARHRELSARARIYQRISRTIIG